MSKKYTFALLGLIGLFFVLALSRGDFLPTAAIPSYFERVQDETAATSSNLPAETEDTPVSRNSNLPYVSQSYHVNPELTPQISTSQVNKLSSELPIYVRDFSTSSGIETIIAIVRYPDDPEYLLRLEIMDVAYFNFAEGYDYKNDRDYIAFKESFDHAIEVLSSKNVDYKNIYFMFSHRAVIHDIVKTWVSL